MAKVTMTMEKFSEYFKVQKSGAFNMFDPRARELTTLSRAEWIDVMKHYEDYLKRWGGMLEVPIALKKLCFNCDEEMQDDLSEKNYPFCSDSCSGEYNEWFEGEVKMRELRGGTR